MSSTSTTINYTNRHDAYEESVNTLLTLTFYSALYIKAPAEESRESLGSVKLTSKKTKKSLKLPFSIFESIVKKLPHAVEKCNSVTAPRKDNEVLLEEIFEINEKIIVALTVSSYQERFWIFIKPKTFDESEDRFVPLGGKLKIITCICLFQ